MARYHYPEDVKVEVHPTGIVTVHAKDKTFLTGTSVSYLRDVCKHGARLTKQEQELLGLVIGHLWKRVER